MPKRTLTQGFELFHKNITPTGYESGKASSHKISITSRLEKDFKLKQLFYSGSANNGTSISKKSDVDFFASIPTPELYTDSSTSLRKIKESLQITFPDTNIYVDSPAVVIDFGHACWDKAEIIPADYIKKVDEKNVYEIPNGFGGWSYSSPSIHNSYVSTENKKLKYKLKPLIRFLKAWKYYCNVPISSFYLELRITKWMEKEDTILHYIDINTILNKLLKCNLAALQDPKSVSGYIHACSSEVKKADAISKLQTAVTRSQKAYDAEIPETNKNTESTFYWLNKLFNNNFPNYNY